MKALIILSLTVLSLNTFAAQVGESLAADCSNTNQSAKREAKVVTQAPSQEEVKAPTSISK